MASSGTGGMLSGFFSKGGGAAGAIGIAVQVVSVDSILLITRIAPSKKFKSDDSKKEYFAVWRKAEPGTFSSASPKSASAAPAPR